MTARILFANNAKTTLAGAITNVATSANLASGTGALFPAISPGSGNYFCMTFNDAATGLLYEVVHVTAIVGDTVTIVRAQEGTTALAWNAGDIAANFVTMGGIEAFAQPADVQAQTGNYAVDSSGAANTITVTLSPAPTAWSDITGAPIRVKMANTNTSSTVNLNVNGLGNKTVVVAGGSGPAAGNLLAGSIYTLIYNGTNVQVVGGGAAAGGSGTVTSASVVSSNGFAGSVANPTTTPAITINTTVTGIVKGNGTAISAAVAGTDYLLPTGNGSLLTGLTQSQITGTAFQLSYDSGGQSITQAGSLTLAHGLGTKPKLMMCYLVCNSAEAGYSPGDEVFMFGPGSYDTGTAQTRGGPSVWADNTNINVRYANLGQGLFVFNKSTGNAALITYANWRFTVRAYA